MNIAIAVAVLTSVFLAAVMLLVPHFSPRRFFFGVTVPPDFRGTEPARQALRSYHATVAAASLIAVALQWILPAVLPLGPVLIATVAAVAFVRERARVRPYAAPSGPAVPDLEGEHLPHWFALAAVPYAALLAVGIWLRTRWDEIPARFPIHWDLNGVPNGWSEKTVRGVYGPLMFGAGISLLILMLALGMFYGARPARIRKPMLGILISATYILAFAFSTAAMLPLVRIKAVYLMVPIFGYSLAVLIWSFKLNADNPGEDTPDDHWKLGMLYYNPADPAILVQKRFGVGYTVNFGNHWALLGLGVFAASIVSLMLLLPR
jgi:uncharacterized membrane protein